MTRTLVTCASRGSIGPTASSLVQVPRAGRVFRRRWASIADETRRDPRSRSNAPRRRTARICSVRVMVLEAFPSLYWNPRARKRARTPARLARLGRGHRAGGITPVKHSASPAVKTDDPSLSPRGARSAVRGIRAWAGSPGRRVSSCSTVLLVRMFMCPRPKGLARTRPRHRLILRERRDRLSRRLPTAESRSR
jgi:hypothetical protein